MANQSSQKQSSQNTHKDFFKNFSLPAFDLEAAMEMHRKNLEVFSKAQKAALSTAKEVGDLHSQYTKKMMNDMRQHMDTFRAAANREDRFKLNSDSFKNGVEQALSHGKEMMNMWSRTNKEIGQSLSQRFKEGVEEAKNIAKSSLKK